ncbi:uncharacterized protein LOC117639719 [Thrips palmi]|uniref:Uncharacterized protein LOC117639719 n=1 Tax=Thrips palmi TaxID=161013 RepID=A0A6P8Y675_THRPL|nr:uncharacterized protein LOC117639719 [Thrips palmi]
MFLILYREFRNLLQIDPYSLTPHRVRRGGVLKTDATPAMARYDPHEFRDFLELSTREGHCQELDDIFLDPDLDRVQLEAKDGTEWKGDVPKGDVPKGGARSLLNALVLHMHRHAGIAPVAGTATNANRRPKTCVNPIMDPRLKPSRV